MRTHGTLVKWNDERGFGFIAPAQGSEELFVHVSAFRRGGARPQVNQLVSFEVRTKPDGKKEAINVMRAGEAAPRSANRRSTRDAAAPRSGMIGSLLSIAAIAAIGWVGYDRYFGGRDVAHAPMAESAGAASSGSHRALPGSVGRVSDSRPAMPASATEPAAAASRPRPAFVCDGREHCSEMASCEEAQFFLRHCPNTKMDGDNDGQPCESQCGQ